MCSNCNKIRYEYEPFSYIIFKKSENINNYANFYSCLNNFYSEKNKKYAFCKSCGKIIPKVKLSICIFPKILTIILSNFDNYDFIIENKLDLKNYANNFPNSNEGIYNLISILCRNKNNNKYSTYYINIFNGLWYCYTDKKIFLVDEMDINDIPMMLIYQASIKDELVPNYKPLKRQNIYKQYFLIKESNKKLSSRKIYYKNEFGKEKDKNSKLNEKIKKLENQLKEEKDKNFGAKFKEKFGLSNFHLFVGANKQKTKKEIELEIQLKEEKDKNLKEKKEYEENFNKMKKDLEEASEKYKNLLNMINYNNDMKEKEKKTLKKVIERYPFKLSKNEKMIRTIHRNTRKRKGEAKR